MQTAGDPLLPTALRLHGFNFSAGRWALQDMHELQWVAANTAPAVVTEDNFTADAKKQINATARGSSVKERQQLVVVNKARGSSEK